MHLLVRSAPLLALAVSLAPGCVRRARTEVEYVAVQQPTAGGVVEAQPTVVVVDARGGAGEASYGAAPAGAGGGAYVLVGADDRTNTYGGDTPTSTPLPVLCLRPAGLPDPGLSGVDRTPGGSLRRRWSGAEVALTEPLAGWALTSREVADQQCASRFGAGWRMAEFHDGGRGAGFDFWALATPSATQGDFASSRFWVAISDQQANPWSSDAAMTWRLLDRR